MNQAYFKKPFKTLKLILILIAKNIFSISFHSLSQSNLNGSKNTSINHANLCFAPHQNNKNKQNPKINAPNTNTHWRFLRAELQNLRRKASIKQVGGSLDRPPFIEVTKACARCLSELGRIINRGAPCRACKLRVCKGCREFSSRTTDWVCVVCHKQMWVAE